nr:MAG TPA: hypothetical protein [Caudoviricetes sp.]
MSKPLSQLANEARELLGKLPLNERRPAMRDLEFTLYRHKLSMIHATTLPEEEREFVEQQAVKLAIKRVNILIDAHKEEKE